MATEQPTGPNPDLMPTPPSGFPAPVPTSQKARRTVIVAGIAGLAIGAAVVGGAWLLFDNDGASASSISAPARISDFVPFGEAEVFDEDGRGKEQADRQRDWDQRSSERLSAAYDGAGAVVRGYTDNQVEGTFTLEAVRAPSAEPFALYSDPEYYGQERPLEEVRTFGQVACAFSNNGPDLSALISCQRTDGSLTVRITHIGGEDLRENPEQVADLVEEVWAEVA